MNPKGFSLMRYKTLSTFWFGLLNICSITKYFKEESKKDSFASPIHSSWALLDFLVPFQSCFRSGFAFEIISISLMYKLLWGNETGNLTLLILMDLLLYYYHQPWYSPGLSDRDGGMIICWFYSYPPNQYEKDCAGGIIFLP